MRATRIIGHGVKGQTFDHKLAPVNIIVGNNASGKSAIAEAAKIGLLGYSLKLGKRPGDTFKLASGPDLQINLRFEDGRENMIDIGMVRGRLKSDVVMQVESPGILLDIQDFFGRSGPERNKFLFQLAGAGSAFNVDEITAALKNIRLENNTSESQAYIGELCSYLDDSDQVRHDMEQPLDQWFAGLLDNFKKKQSNTDAVVKQMRNSIQASVALQATEGMPQAIRPGIEAELAAARAAVEGLRLDLQKIQSRLAEVERAKQQRQAAEAELAKWPELNDDTALYRNALKQAEEAMAAVEEASKDDGDLGIMAENVKRAERAWCLGFSEDKAQSNWETTRATEHAYRAALNQIGASKDKIAELDGKLAGHCPKCGAEAEHWSDEIKQRAKNDLAIHRRALKSLQDSLPDIELQKIVAEKRVKIDTDNRANHAEALRQLSEARLAYQKYHGELLLKRSAARQEAQLHVNNARNGWSNRQLEIDNAIARRQAAQRRLEALPSDLTIGLAEVIAKEFECVAMAKAWSEKPTINDYIGEVQYQITEAEKKVRNLETEQRMAMKAQAAIAAREQAKVELEANEMRSAILKEALAILVEKQAAVITNGLRGFMAKAGTLTETVLGMKLEYKDGEIGCYKADSWVSIDTFSGAEEYLAIAGLCLAFAPNAPCKMVIVDELGRIDKVNKAKLLKRMKELTDNKIVDNFIGIDVSLGDYTMQNAIDGVNIIEVGV